MSYSNFDENNNDEAKIIVEAVKGIPQVEIPNGFRDDIMRAIRIEASLCEVSAEENKVGSHRVFSLAKIAKRRYIYIGGSVACLLLAFIFIVSNPAMNGGYSKSEMQSAPMESAAAPASAPMPAPAAINDSSYIAGEIFETDDLFAMDEVAALNGAVYQSAAGAAPELAVSEEEAGSYSGAQETVGGSVMSNQPSSNQKLIKTMYYTIETTDFDKAVSEVQRITNEAGGYVENYYSGIYSVYSDNSGRRDLRNGEIRIRVPQNEYTTAKIELEKLGKTVSVSENIENVTSSYVDVAARLEVKKAEERRLLELYGKADKIEDLISLESRLTYVRSDIESMTSQINNWDRSVAFSTISISLTEVVDYSQIQSIDPTLGQKIIEGFNRSAANFTYNVERLIIGLAENSIAILLLVAVAVIVFIVVGIYRRRKLKERTGDNI